MKPAKMAEQGNLRIGTGLSHLVELVEMGYATSPGNLERRNVNKLRG
ncbi:MAG: hypothetical protein K6T90_14040 [Leptolyngbyaceae cyanobacterium HOT.MB2.61]|nr:hypothetical protein [Leptolyngbyaceae cyanobacterium HOT.MB2.61]